MYPCFPIIGRERGNWTKRKTPEAFQLKITGEFQLRALVEHKTKQNKVKQARTPTCQAAT